MSRPPGEIAAHILLNPGTAVMLGIAGFMLFTGIKAATSGRRDRASARLSKGAIVFPLAATFAGVRRLPSLVAIASNNARPLFAMSAKGIEYRVIRRRNRSFADIEHVDVRTSWKTVNIEFLFRGEMLTFAVNAGNDATARTILQSMPESISMGQQAAVLRS